MTMHNSTDQANQIHQVNMFETLYNNFKFNKDTITLFEAFSGIGGQAKALEKLSNEVGFNLDTIGISEIDPYAIKSYMAVHGETKNYGSITEIEEIPQVDIFTYSPPCQDISKAGMQKGFSKGSGTRSELLWEVERLLKHQAQIKKLPRVMLLENVRALASKKFSDEFYQFRKSLEELGYKNYWQILNSKDYGIPQNRERVFMISILGDYSYTFPKSFKLELKLMDFLESNVNQKFYLSKKALRYAFKRSEKFNRLPRINNDITHTLLSSELAKGSSQHIELVTEDFIRVPEASKKGYAEATIGDGIYINRAFQKRGVVQKDMVHTIKTSMDIGIVVEDLKIRKLTPKECWRLMGFDDESFEKAKQVCSNTQLYKQAGNSIVVDVLYYIFKQLFDEEYIQ